MASVCQSYHGKGRGDGTAMEKDFLLFALSAMTAVSMVKIVVIGVLGAVAAALVVLVLYVLSEDRKKKEEGRKTE